MQAFKFYKHPRQKNTPKNTNELYIDIQNFKWRLKGETLYQHIQKRVSSMSLIYVKLQMQTNSLLREIQTSKKEAQQGKQTFEVSENHCQQNCDGTPLQ